MDYYSRDFKIFIRYSSKLGHYLFFFRIPFFYIYISSFPTVLEKKCILCNYEQYKKIVNYWKRNLRKPNMMPYPKSRDTRRQIFQELVKKPNEE